MARVKVSALVGAVHPFVNCAFAISNNISLIVIKGSWFRATKAPDAFCKEEPVLAQCDAYEWRQGKHVAAEEFSF